MEELARSRSEWVLRFSLCLARFARQGLTLAEVLLLAKYQYNNAYDANPERMAARLIDCSDPQVDAAAAAYSAAILIRKVSAPGYRVGM